MVRETRHLWVGNLPENIREDRIRDHFKRYGRVQNVKLLGRGGKDEENGGGGVCATVSFMDIKSAAKAHHSEQKLDERTLTTEYHEPAAIPGPSQVYGSSTTTTNSTSTPRFSTHGGSEDLSASFDRSSHFYERSERSETSGGSYIRRSGSTSATTGGYHPTESLSRSRGRDRLYRNGPYTPLIERDSKQRIVEPRKSSENDELVRHSRVVSRNQSSHHRVGSWGYDSPSPRYSSQVPSTPELPYSEERRETTPVVHKKHSKSSISRRSGSDTGSNSGSSRSRSSSASSQSGSSTCSTTSSSPTSEKSCSTHSQQSALRGGPQSAVSAPHTNSNSPAVHSEDRRPLAICVRNLPARSSDTSLKDGLYHEYKKHGKVTWVKVVGQGIDRYALVCFKKPEDVDKALQVSHDKLFFGCKIEVAPYQGYDVDDNEFRPFEAEQDEFHPKATRTLFIGNLEKDITTQEIRKHFEQFGEIIDIDIKKQGTSSSYAFCQFSDIGSVVRAMRTLDGEHIGSNRIKLGFGKSMHTNSVWVDGVSETVTEKYLSQQFGQFGPVNHVAIDRVRGHALVFFEQITYAQQAVKEMRGVVLRGRKLQVDYASRECQEAFYDRLDKQTTSHPTFENNVQASPQSNVSTSSRVFDNQTVTSTSTTPSSARYTGTPTAISTGSRYTTSGTGARTFPRPASTSPATPNTASPSTSIRSSRHPAAQRFDFSEYMNERRSYRSYEDSNLEDGSSVPAMPTTPLGPTVEIRHLQKERVALLEQLEDCTSSGEEGAGRRRCKHRRSQSGDGSRPGTPLCDERPENLPPVEPRRTPRDRPPDPLSLPLPRFASQVLSPRPAPPSPPASPQTPHSSSSDSEPSPPSPEWEERLRSLDEKYEKWTGSRTGIAKTDSSMLKARHKLLELDIHELKPSEIVKSVLAKRSVFDEDSKRLENFSDKYEPREFIPANRANLLRRLDSPLSSPVSKSPGLQYPFPSHPPLQLTSNVVTPSTPTPPGITTSDIKSTTPSTFLTNCSRLLQPKIIPPPINSIETSPRPSTQPLDKFKKCPPPVPQPVKKELITTLKPKPCPIRRDSTSEKLDLRRKSRDDMIPDSAIKKDDTSESDKVKDAQVCERRKSSVEKRRNSVETKDVLSKDIVCDRPKDIISDNKKEDKRRTSSESEVNVDHKVVKEDDPKRINQTEPTETQPIETFRSSEQDKLKKINDSLERRNDTIVRHNSTETHDKKKDVLGVNSERDKRRCRESVDSLTDNPNKNKKVPETKKDDDISSFFDKHDKEDDVNKSSESSEKKKDDHINQINSKKEKKEQDKRRDSSESDKSKSDKSPDHIETPKHKDHKSNKHQDSDKSDKPRKDEIEPKNSKKEDLDEQKTETKHHKEEKRKNHEKEISKEHSLFKKVFGFADSIRHHKDLKDSESSNIKTDHDQKHRERSSDKKKDKEDTEVKHKSRKSPDSIDNNRHREKKSDERKKKEINNEDKKEADSDSIRSKSERRKNSLDSLDLNEMFLPSNDYTKFVANDVDDYNKHISDGVKHKHNRKTSESSDNNRHKDDKKKSEDRKKKEVDDDKKETESFHSKSERRKNSIDLNDMFLAENDINKFLNDDGNEDYKYISDAKPKHHRKSPENSENNRHKEDKKKYDDRKKKELDDDKKEVNDFHSKSDKKKEGERYKDLIEFHHPVEDSFKNCNDNDVHKLTSVTTEDHHEKYKENDITYEQRKENHDKNKEAEKEKRRDFMDNFDKYMDRIKDHSKSNQKEEKRNDSSDTIRVKHHSDSDRKSKDHSNSDNCKSHERHKSTDKKDSHRHKEEKMSNDIFEGLKPKDDKTDIFDGIKTNERKDSSSNSIKTSRDDHPNFRKDDRKEISERKKEEKEQRRKERELHTAKREAEERKEKFKKKDFELHEPKVNGDHHEGEYHLDSIECRKSSISLEYNEMRIESIKKEKRKDKSTWPATIGCKRRLSSQDSLDISEDAKRSKPERRDSKDSGRSSGSSRKGSGEKHNKGFTKLLEEKIKEDKEKEMRKKDEQELLRHEDEKTPKPAIRKEKRNSGEKRKEDRKLKIRPRECRTASDSDGSGDEESKARKRQQHSIFDIVDDEPAYISMYDKVKARSTKNMQKQEEEKRQEKLKEKFHQLKQSRAKREEKKRSTSYDEDSDSEKGSIRRNRLLLTSSEDDGDDSDIRNRTRKIFYDTSEDDMIVTSRKNSYPYDDKSIRKIVSDVSEDEAIVKRVSPKVKSRNISFDSESKSRKIMSDTSEDDNSRLIATPRIVKPIRIHSDDSEGDLGFEDSIRPEAPKEFALNEIYSNRPDINHFKNDTIDEPSNDVNQASHSSPESFRRNSIDGINSEQSRKKSHKKKQKREDGSMKKRCSKKEKKRSHRDEDEKKSRKKRSERDSSNKREDKLEDIFGPLSDDSEKAVGKWQVSQVYGTDSESERENIRKKEKKREKFFKNDESYFQSDFLGDSEKTPNTTEHIKKKKKRKKSRDEKIKHHRNEDHSVNSVQIKEEKNDISHNLSKVKEESEDEIKKEIENQDYVKNEIKTEIKVEQDATKPQTISCLLDSLLDSPQPSQCSTPKKPDIPGFGSEVDETIHETAIKSISESPCTTLDDSDIKFTDKSKSDDHSTIPEDKPAPTISQEETEDAVAALLMEDAFGGGFEGYSEGTPKPDTPVSEPDLQIDTDTEDTFDHMDFSRPPRTPDIPASFYRQNESREGLEERIMSLACSSDTPLKDSPKSLQMPPTPDYQFDKKNDSSDSDSFEAEEKSPDKSPAKDMMEIDADSDKDLNDTKDSLPDMLKIDEESQDMDDSADEKLSSSLDSSDPVDIKPECPQKIEPPVEEPIKSGPSLPIIQVSSPQAIPVPTLVPLSKPETPVFHKVESVVQKSPLRTNPVVIPVPPSTVQSAQIKPPDVKPLVVQAPLSPADVKINSSSPIQDTIIPPVVQIASPPVRPLTPEKVMPKPHLLTSQIIRPNVVTYSYPQINPLQIPVHPTVVQETPKPVLPIIEPVTNVQKQLQIVTPTPNLSSQSVSPISPQNLKLVKPIVTPQQTIPIPLSQPSRLPNPVPLLQPVKVDEHKLSTPYPQPKNQLQIPNPMLLHAPGQSAPHPERVINLSPSQPLTSVNSLKPVIQSSPEHSVEWNLKKVENKPIDLKNKPENDIKVMPREPVISHVLKEPIINTQSQNLAKEIPEPIELQVKKSEEYKPLNAVIQVLTMRAANKATLQPTTNENEQPQFETSKPMEQVVRELTMRKKSAENKEPEINSQPENLVNTTPEPKIDLPVKEDNKETPIALVVEKPATEDLKITEDEKMEIDTPIIKEHVDIKEPTEIKTPVRDVESPKPEKSPCLDKKPPKIEENDVKSPKFNHEPEPQLEEKPPIKIAEQPVVRGGRGGRRRRGVGGRGGGVSTRRTRHNNATPAPSTDIYEFRDDSEEETGRPRLILTIKSPPEPQPVTRSRSPQAPPLNNTTPTTTRKSRRLQVISNDIELSRAKRNEREGPNTRRTRSKRLQINYQEKDGKSSVDDTIEDVVRGRPGRRSTRSTTHTLVAPPVVETVRKSPRRKQHVPPPAHPQPQQSPPLPSSPQPAAAPAPSTPPPQIQPTPITPATSAQPLTPLPAATMTRALPLSQSRQNTVVGKLIRPGATEPTTLIDPVTGLLIPMRESEEGQYIPVHNDRNSTNAGNANKEPVEGEPPEKRQRLLQNEEAIARTPPNRVSVVRPFATPSVINTVATAAVPPHTVVSNVSKAVITPTCGTPMDTMATRPIAPPRAHSSIPILTPKAHLLQAVAPSRVKLPPVPTPPPAQLPKGPAPMTPKGHIIQSIGNAQPREVIIGSPAPHQGSIITGSLPSPPSMVTGASSTRVVMKPDGVQARIIDGNLVLPSASMHTATSRNQVMQAGMPITAFEASLHVLTELQLNQWLNQRIPPPAHQIQGEHAKHHPPSHYVPNAVSVYHQLLLREAGIPAGPYHRAAGMVKGADVEERGGTMSSPPLELRRGSPHDNRATDSPQVANVYMHGSMRHHMFYDGMQPPPAHRPQSQLPSNQMQMASLPYPIQQDTLSAVLMRYPVMWQGLLALKTDKTAVQMHFLFGNPTIARKSLPCNYDGTTPPLRIAQRMRLEQSQLDGVARKMLTDEEHCVLLALPCGRDPDDVLLQSTTMNKAFTMYLQSKQAAGIVNIASPGTLMPAYVVHIFPACDFANENLTRIAPDLSYRISGLSHLIVIIATV